MISEQEAENLVKHHFSEFELPEGDDWVIVAEETIRKDWGWIYFYTARKWRETGDLEYAIAGNAPLLIERETGKVFVTGTASSVAHYIQNYESTGNPNG